MTKKSCFFSIVTLCAAVAFCGAALETFPVRVASAQSQPTAATQGDEDRLGQAEDFIANFSARAIDQLSDTSLDTLARKERFQELLEEGFNIPYISRFIVARYWRAAPEEKRREFIDIFGEYLSNRFAPLFEGYNKENFTVTNSYADRKYPDIVWVNSTALKEDGGKVYLEWRIRQDDNQFQIVDLKAEGASMALTLRDEYGSIMRQKGGLEGLNVLLAQEVSDG